MSRSPRAVLAAGLAAGWLAAGGLASLRADSARRTEERPAAVAGIEVQARGPVHEAFAQLTPTNPDPPPAVAKEPPAAVPERPPDQKPDGANVQWIPGYWSWDADKKDFLWVSGTWRAAPAERQWVPGYWARTDDGWQWVPGFWADGRRDRLDYLPEPPASLDYGPSQPAPNENSFWVPGCWLPYPDRWVWRPGFWAACSDGRVWTPSRFAWTPNGYLFVNGYWDYPLEDRGLLFAPAYFSRPLWSDPGWSYQPSYVVGIGPLLGSFWARPGWGHYYFGDWYGRRYGRLGFTPWLTHGRRSSDPLYSYYNWAHRRDPGWARGLRADYIARRDGNLALPPRTLAAQSALRSADRRNLQVVTPLNQFRDPNVRLASLSSSQLAAQRGAAQSLNSFGQSRARLEAVGRPPARGTGPSISRSNAALRLPTSGAVAAANNAVPRTSFGAPAARRGAGGWTGTPSRGPAMTNGVPSSRPAFDYRGPVIRNGASAGPSSFGRPAFSYRPGPSYGSMPSFRAMPSFSRSAPSFRGGGGGYRGGGGSRSGGHGGHR